MATSRESVASRVLRCPLVTVIGVMAFATVPAIAFHGDRVYVSKQAGCSGHAYRPQHIDLTCDATSRVERIRYSSYNGKVALGHGLIVLSDCHPTCKNGRRSSYAITIELAQIVRCSDHRLYYTRLYYSFRGTHPNVSLPGKANLNPGAQKRPLRCSPPLLT